MIKFNTNEWCFPIMSHSKKKEQPAVIDKKIILCLANNYETLDRDDIAKRIDNSYQTVKNGLNRLKEHNILEEQNIKKELGRGRGKTNSYTFGYKLLKTVDVFIKLVTKYFDGYDSQFNDFFLSDYCQNMINQQLVKKIKIEQGYKRDADFKEVFLFCWDDIPGDDNGRLIDYLKNDIDIDWEKNVNIEKIDNGDTIKVYTDKSKESTILITDECNKNIQVPNPNNFLKISLRKVKNRADLLQGNHPKTLTANAFNAKSHALLLTEDGRAESLVVKNENGKLNIYKSTWLEALLDFEKLKYYLSDKDLEWILRTSPTALKEALDPKTNNNSQLFNELMLLSFSLDVRKNGGCLIGDSIDFKYSIYVQANINEKHKFSKFAEIDFYKNAH